MRINLGGYYSDEWGIEWKRGCRYIYNFRNMFAYDTNCPYSTGSCHASIVVSEGRSVLAP